MNDIHLPITAVRSLLLAAQGLLKPPTHPATKEDLLNTIRRMGALQIDTIHVVARSPYLVLFSRLGAYDLRWLEELLDEGRLFEYWSHAACFLPIEDYPLYRSMMFNHSLRHFSEQWRNNHVEAIERVLQYVRENGEVKSADFERTDGQKGSWWNWKEEKVVLEYLHTSGELMIARRVNFHRVYNLRERVLPDWDDSQALPLEETRAELTVRAVRALGAAPAAWVPDYFRLLKQGIAKRMEQLVDAGRLERITVEGWDQPWYFHPENLSLLEWAMTGELEPTHTTLLSPFDPLVWDRERARVLFDFDYTIECYTPEGKRRYGYFSLPILCMGKLVGRLDAKAHRKEGIFEIKALHLEPNTPLNDDLAGEVAAAIQRCAGWHATPQVLIRKSDPERFGQMIEAHLVGIKNP